MTSNDYPEQFDSADRNTYFKDKFLEEDPTVTLDSGIELQLALDTSQIGRTFQDRSHLFVLQPRSAYQINDNKNIENLQVRGKRGNIVQTFPAVEYDFSPRRLEVDTQTYVHVQWAGSNSNPEDNAGEGTAGTDRSNMVTVDDVNWNIPQGTVSTGTSNKGGNSMWNNVEWIWTQSDDKSVMDNLDNLEVQMATSGYYDCVDNCEKSIENKSKVNKQLNNAPASFHGNLVRFKKAGKSYHYLSTRNNNFSNRAQKGEIITDDPK